MPEDTRLPMILQELVRRTNEESRRLRDLEQRIAVLEEKTGSLEDINLSKNKKINDKFAEIEVTVKTAVDDIAKIKNSVEKITSQINKFARKQDVKEIEKMFDLLSPLRQEFVTKDELEELVTKKD